MYTITVKRAQAVQSNPSGEAPKVKDACCPPAELAACCEPSDKAACCEATHEVTLGCGCR